MFVKLRGMSRLWKKRKNKTKKPPKGNGASNQHKGHSWDRRKGIKDQ